MSEPILLLCSNAVTALAYFIITYQLIMFARSFQLARMLESLRNSKDKKKRNLFIMIVCLAILFASFIALCGGTHLVATFRYFYPDYHPVRIAQTVVLVLCAIVSTITALYAYKIFPLVLDVLGQFELNAEGNLQHVENYMIEVVELVQESVIVLSDDLKVQRCNEASKLLFGTSSLVGDSIVDHVCVEDRALFNEAVLGALSGYSQVPYCIEYRIARSFRSAIPAPSPKYKKATKNSPGGTVNRGKVYVAGDDSPSLHQHLQQQGQQCFQTSKTSVTSYKTDRGSSDSLSSPKISIELLPEIEYVWVESTICKGMRLNQDEDFEYDLKMITRNIDDRKKLVESEYHNIMRESEEKDRMNAAKLRYISCVAHDLKTPLQSFTYTIDLLMQTVLNVEQREIVEQATVAVDLMKLTISQTMDITKALTGARIQPRCGTVHLSAVLDRVKVIINGYGKQVPVGFEVAKEVCDTIITDEEWLWQMMLNLLTNACKYTDRGGIHVSIRIERDMVLPGSQKGTTLTYSSNSVTRQHSALLFEVADTGVGVSSEKLASLFDAYSQVQDGQVTGTGLGLFGVRTRAEGLGGSCGARLNTESSTGSGTVIWFAIPYVPDMSRTALRSANSDPALNEYLIDALNNSAGSAHFDALVAASVAGPVTTSIPIAAGALTNTLCNTARRTEEYIRSKQMTAMVVDDTLTVRKLMERVLLKMGFARVECYENGSKGLEAMMAQQVDIVFSDVQMPIMTGPEMVSRFRAFETTALQMGERLHRQLVVAVTANGAQAGVSSGGFDEICPKPLSSSDIYEIINKYL